MKSFILVALFTALTFTNPQYSYASNEKDSTLEGLRLVSVDYKRAIAIVEDVKSKKQDVFSVSDNVFGLGEIVSINSNEVHIKSTKVTKAIYLHRGVSKEVKLESQKVALLSESDFLKVQSQLAYQMYFSDVYAK